MIGKPLHMLDDIRIENLDESNIDDLIYVCSSTRLNDPIHQRGIELKKQWLREMLAGYGSIAKIAYRNEKPVAQILYYPEEADLTSVSRREDVLVILCIYNPTSTTQRLGISTRLLQNVIQDVRQRETCLGNKPCKFILTKAFNTGESLPLPEFFRKKGFLTTPKEDMLYFPIEGSFEPAEALGEYEPRIEDRNKAVVLYSPSCQFSYPFARKIEELIGEVAPNTRVEMINQWEKPEESMKRKNWWLIVNAKPIHTFFMDTDRFKAEIQRVITETSVGKHF